MSTLGALGEVAALARVLPRLPAAAAALLGPGDDAAVLASPGGSVVLTVDAMVEGPDFRRSWSTPFELGWKVTATNLADVAAMGATPTGLLVALAAPPSTPVADLEALADGIAAACAALAPGCGALGGDLTRAPVLVLTVTATGTPPERPVRRDGARPGDVLAYAGELGRAATALRLLFAAGDDADAVAALRDRDPALLATQLSPSPPLMAGPAAAAAGASAMLDVSDGLVLDAGRIAAASGVVLDLDRLALAPDVAAAQVALGDPEAALAAVLAGGEDHGLLATFPPRAVLPAAFRVLGAVRDGQPAVLLDGRRPPRAAGPAGWDSFADPQFLRRSADLG